MLRKKSPRLAAAFVVTISAGCGGATPPPENGTNETSTTVTDAPKKPDGPENPDWVPNIGTVKGGLEKDGDGKCFIVHPANPPWREPVDCATQEPLKKPETEKPKPPDPPPAPTGTTGTLTPRPPDETNLPDAPKGMTVRKNSDGSCMAFSSSSKCPPNTRCNPPPPMKVKCPRDLPKEVADPAKI